MHERGVRPGRVERRATARALPVAVLRRTARHRPATRRGLGARCDPRDTVALASARPGGGRGARAMTTVRNWQLGRDMAYPHAEHHPDRQFAFVFNINRCIACQTCSMACKSTWTFSKGQETRWGNNVETKPK